MGGSRPAHSILFEDASRFGGGSLRRQCGTALPASSSRRTTRKAPSLARTTRRLLDGAEPGEFDVVVVANACTDRTADLARAIGRCVIETDVPGKVNARCPGRCGVPGVPRAYVDADVGLTLVRASGAGRRGGAASVLGLCPLPWLDLTGGRTGCRTRASGARPFGTAPGRALAGSACMCSRNRGAWVLDAGRVISDDGWVHNSFTPDERVVVSEARSVVRPAAPYGHTSTGASACGAAIQQRWPPWVALPRRGVSAFERSPTSLPPVR